MDLYHIWCDLKPGTSDVAFAEHVAGYLDALARDDRIEGYRLTRRKLGLGPADLGEFHIVIEARDLAQLDDAFRAVSSRTGPLEGLHAAVNQSVRRISFALYRDFPDPQRERGSEAF